MHADKRDFSGEAGNVVEKLFSNSVVAKRETRNERVSISQVGAMCAKEKPETGSCLNACANDKSVTVIGGVTLTALGSTNDNANGSNVDGSGDGSRGLDSDKPPWPAVISVNCRRGHFSLHGLGFCPGRRRCKYP